MDVVLSHVLLQPFKLFAGYVDHFIRPSAFRILDDQFPILDILWSQFEYLTYSHSSSGHQFKYQPVTNVETSENDFIDDVLINYLPLIWLRPFEYLSNHCGAAWIRQVGLRGIDREIEKGSKDRIAVSLGRLCVDRIGLSIVALQHHFHLHQNMLQLLITLKN